MGVLLYHSLLLILGIFVLLRAGVYVVRSLSAMARYLRFSEFVLSFILLAFATSLAELTVGASSAISGIPELSLGDILGTNIVNLALILGFVAVLGGELELKDYQHFKEGRLFLFLLLIAPLIMLLDGTLSRIDGAFLLAFFSLNILRMLRERERKMVVERKVLRHSLEAHAAHIAATRREFLHRVLVFAISVPLLVASAYVMIFAIRNIAALVHAPEFLIGLFIVSIGTSLPELSVGIRSVTLNKDGVSLGNLFGASALNATLILGVVSLIHPITVARFNAFLIAGIFLVLIISVIYLFLRKRKFLTRKEGFILVTLYLLFVIAQTVIL